jgi:ferredoxin-nitrite reductase
MLRKMEFLRRSEDEEIKESGLVLDFDEIARKGGLSGDEKNIAKWYGIYTSRQPGSHMARVVIPGGVITSTQARNIAKAAEDYGQGKLSITTRQAIQLHWLKAGRLSDLIRDLTKDGLSTKHGCGDVTRNVASCPLAESCQYKRFDVRPISQKTAKFLTDSKDLDNLPRKFKITYSGCGAGCAQPYINCVGAIAIKSGQNGNTQKGFKVVIGGGMGWKAFVAQELFSFVPEERMVYLTRAIALLFRDHGDRFNRSKARLKYVVYRYGIKKCRDIVLENLKKEGISTDGLETGPVVDTGIPYPDRPLTEEGPIGTDGSSIVRIRIPKGELNYRQFKRIAELSEIYGNQRVYTTNRQNIELNSVNPEKVGQVKSEIEKIGLGIDGFFGLRDIVACVGTTYCPKAVSETRRLFDMIYPVVSLSKYKPIDKKALVNITGCPNSCSPYRISDIGFRGMRIPKEIGSVEAYEMLIGGTQKDFGKKLGDFKLNDCPEVLETVLDTFLELREENETLAGCLTRVGVDAFTEAVFNEV